MSFLHQALGAVRARLTPAPPVSAHSAQPQPGRVGASPFRALGPAPGSAEPLTAWDRDPDTGAALPAGPQVSLGPTEWVHARIAHRHGWFATLAHRAAQGDAAAAARAIETMEGWLRQDILDWMAGQLHLSASAVTTPEARIPPSSPRPCSRTCIRREGCSTRLRATRVFTPSARATDTETSA